MTVNPTPKFWQNVERGGDSVGVGDVWSGGEKVVGRNETKRENREGLEMKQNERERERMGICFSSFFPFQLT